MWLGCQIFMCQCCEVAAVTSLLVRKALHYNEGQVSSLHVTMTLMTPLFCC